MLDEKLYGELQRRPNTPAEVTTLFMRPAEPSEQDEQSATSEDKEPESFLLTERINTTPTPPEMIFEELWPTRSIGLFTGDGGIGKTHLTLQLLLAIASGGSITGTPFKCPKARPVVYVTQEDEGNFILDEFRTQEPSLKNNQKLTDQIRVVSTVLQGSNLSLRNPESRSYLIGQLPDECVFALDSWSTFLTCNENDNTELLKEIGWLREIMKARKASCLLIHHRPKINPQTGIKSAFRGGTALPNSCRFHIMVEKKGPNVKLSFEKVSRGTAPEALELTFDETKRLFVPSALDRIVNAFQLNEKLTTSVLMGRLGLNPQDPQQKKRAADWLRYRTKGGYLAKIQKESPGQDAVWERVK